MKVTAEIQALVKGHDLGKMNVLEFETLLKKQGFDLIEKGDKSLAEVHEMLVQLKKEFELKMGEGSV